jgi:hypothetical protein
MRFAWLRENSADLEMIKQARTHPLALIRSAYNIAFWFFLLPFFTVIDFSTGFVVTTIIIGIRLALNFYMNNALDLTPQEYDRFPFRIP